MSTFRTKLLPEVLVPLLLALGAALPLFYQVVVLAPQQPDNVETFYSFSSGLDHYFELKTAWKTRLFSNALAWQVDRAAADLMSRVDVQYINRPQPFALALWTAAWFLATCLVYILFVKQRAVLYILGTYAALTFGYVPKLPATRVYPWDMPALFVFALFLFLFLRNRFKWILILLPLAVGFKETAGVLCVAFLLAPELSRRDKWRMFLAAFVLCLLVKLGIDLFTRSASPLFTMETGLGGALSASYLLQNLKAFASLPPFLINAGTLLSFFVLPAVHPKVSALKVIAVLFAAGNFLFGTVLEFRIWFELIPFALFAVESAAYPALTESAPEISVPER
jgi:hypothetical protein